MSEKFRVKPIWDEKNGMYYEVQIYNGSSWCAIIRNSKPLSFRIEKMAFVAKDQLCNIIPG